MNEVIDLRYDFTKVYGYKDGLGNLVKIILDKELNKNMNVVRSDWS